MQQKKPIVVFHDTKIIIRKKKSFFETERKKEKSFLHKNGKEMTRRLVFTGEYTHFYEEKKNSFSSHFYFEENDIIVSCLNMK
jgi:hypothetical protein